MNVVIVVGRLTRDPEIRYTADGTVVASFGVASNDFAGGKEITEFFDCIAWRKVAESVGEHARKGRLVWVQGVQHTNKWTDPQGQKRSRTELTVNTIRYLDKPVEADTREEEPRESLVDLPF